MSGMPPDPDLQRAVTGIWDTFCLLQAAGFSEHQALSLVSDMLRASRGG